MAIGQRFPRILILSIERFKNFSKAGNWDVKKLNYKIGDIVKKDNKYFMYLGKQNSSSFSLMDLSIYVSFLIKFRTLSTIEPIVDIFFLHF